MNTENTEVLAEIASGGGDAFQLRLVELTAPELEEIAHRLDTIKTGSNVKDRESRFFAAHLRGEAWQIRRWERDERASGRHQDGFVYENFIVATRPNSIAAGLIRDIHRHDDELDAIGREVLERPDVREQNVALQEAFLVQALGERISAEELLANKSREIMLQSLLLGMAIDMGNDRVKENPEYESIGKDENPPPEGA